MFTPDTFAGKIALVTGAGSGIGRACAIAFAKAGAGVAIVGRTESKLAETEDLVRKAGGRSLRLVGDVTDEAQVANMIGQIETQLGRLDFVVNNAGVEQPKAALCDIDCDTWDRQLATNLTAAYLGMKYQVPALLRQGGGAIVNIASGAAVMGIAGQAAYCAAKFGLVGLSKAAALDYADRNIRINVVSPGMVATPMMDRFTGGTEQGRAEAIAQEPVGRAGQPEEIAAAALWLCTDAAAFTVGANLVVDGGQTV